MKLLQVIPITKSLTKESLSYFSNKNIEKGSIVFVPLRKKTVPSIVVDVENVSNAKSRLRNSEYSIKRIESHSTNKFLLPEFMKAVEETAPYFASTIGQMMNQVVPKIFFEQLENIAQYKSIQKSEDNKLSVEKLVLQTDYETRIFQYKNIVRESFARNSSVYIATGTIRAAERLGKELSKGIEKYVFVLHSDISKKKLLDKINEAIEQNHGILIIGTGSFLSLPRNDIKTIILEGENARGYKMQSRPFVDYRILAEALAEKLGARLIFADLPIRIETEWRYRRGEYDELITRKSLVPMKAKYSIVDMRPDKDDEDKKFKMMSSELLDVLDKSKESKENIFLLNARRGLAPTTVCEDCGSVVTCHTCNSPTVLHRAGKENVFTCHKCGEMRSALEKCKVCDSWRLKVLGIGVERVKVELEKRYPERKIISVDRDTTKTHKQIEKAVELFYNTPGSILIGTEMALGYLEKPIPYTAIVSIDSLLALPDANVYERIFSLLFAMREITSKKFIMQTRQPDLSVITHARDGNIQGFFNDEIEPRKQLSYPPFSIIIKITTIGTQQKIIGEMEELEDFFKDFSFQIYPAFTPLSNRKYALHGIMKIPRNEWPNIPLVEKIQSLPPNFSVNVNPESTL